LLKKNSLGKKEVKEIKAEPKIPRGKEPGPEGKAIVLG